MASNAEKLSMLKKVMSRNRKLNGGLGNPEQG
jgi:hypothetical protein